jgi:hypothetical protein
MRQVLRLSAFPHDLDPHFASGFVEDGDDLLIVSASGDQNQQAGTDPRFFTIWHSGPRSLRSFGISLASANPTGRPPGLVFDERLNLGMPFVVGEAQGINPAHVSHSYQDEADAPGVAGQWKMLRLRFLADGFGDGDLLAFAVDRDEADAAGPAGAVAGGSADLLGRGVRLPSGEIRTDGARFFGAYEGTQLGGFFSGQFTNQIGQGYSPLDGYGFINAEAAVNSVLVE